MADERLKRAQEFASKQQARADSEEVLKAKARNGLTITYNNGTFEITRGLFAYIGLMLYRGDRETVVMDRDEKPIHIESLRNFFGSISEAYAKTTQKYYEEWKALGDKS